MVVKILALFFPILLYVFKYILPSWAEGVYTNRKREKEQAKIELLHFPVDLLFVAVGYTIPKIIEVTSQLALMEKITEDLDEYRRLVTCVGIYCAESFAILMLVPFFVFAAKFAENNYYKGKKRWIVQTVSCYVISMGIIWITIFIV